MMKTMEELGETAAAIARGKVDGVMDGIGDTVVCLTILAAQHGIYIEDCIEAAYDQIKDRTGRVVDGVFVRDV
jgi:NTP pyrophosphatase (non-canonical NTP hydrolase)